MRGAWQVCKYLLLRQTNRMRAQTCLHRCNKHSLSCVLLPTVHPYQTIDMRALCPGKRGLLDGAWLRYKSLEHCKPSSKMGQNSVLLSRFNRARGQAGVCVAMDSACMGDIVALLGPHSCGWKMNMASSCDSSTGESKRTS
uniref:Uncharacterized protein n=1 Tax=Pseudo-nitzschia australis TaxID=44445 RepID=A0A7S4ARA1_9STRA